MYRNENHRLDRCHDKYLFLVEVPTNSMASGKCCGLIIYMQISVG